MVNDWLRSLRAGRFCRADFAALAVSFSSRLTEQFTHAVDFIKVPALAWFLHR
jgi:hypothetical protein